MTVQRQSVLHPFTILIGQSSNELLAKQSQAKPLSRDSFSAREMNGLTWNGLTMSRAKPIDSSLRAMFENKTIGIKYDQTPPASAAVIEFDALNRLTFATREAQVILQFALDPPWGQSLSMVLRRVPQPLSRIEWLIPAVQPPSPTTRALGAAFAWLRLMLSEERVLTICLRSQP